MFGNLKQKWSTIMSPIKQTMAKSGPGGAGASGSGSNESGGASPFQSPSKNGSRGGGGGSMSSGIGSPGGSGGGSGRPAWWMDAQAIRQGVHDSAKRLRLLTGHWESLEECIKASLGCDKPYDLSRLPIRNNLASIVALLCEEDRDIKTRPYPCFEYFIEKQMFEIICPDHVCRCFVQLRTELARSLDILLQILSNNSLLKHQTTVEAINILLQDCHEHGDSISKLALSNLLYTICCAVGKEPAYLAHFLRGMSDDDWIVSPASSSDVSKSSSSQNLRDTGSYHQDTNHHGAVISGPSSPSPPPSALLVDPFSHASPVAANPVGHSLGTGAAKKKNRDPFNQNDCLVLTLLTELIHAEEADISDRARAAFLPLLQVSQVHPSLARAIIELNSCAYLVAGLSGYYSNLPPELPVPLSDWISITQSKSLSSADVSSQQQLQKYQQQLQQQLDLHSGSSMRPLTSVSRSLLHIPTLDKLVQSLDFCNQVASRATPEVSRALAQSIRDIFLNVVLGPALNQGTKEGTVAACTYFEQCLSELTDPRLLRVFVEFVLAFEDQSVKQLLVRQLGRGSSEIEVIASLRLIHTMLLTFRADAFCGLVIQDVANSEVGEELRKVEQQQARQVLRRMSSANSIGTNGDGFDQTESGEMLSSPTSEALLRGGGGLSKKQASTRAQLSQWRETMEEYARNAALYLSLHPYALSDISPDQSGYENYIEQARQCIDRCAVKFRESIKWCSASYLAPFGLLGAQKGGDTSSSDFIQLTGSSSSSSGGGSANVPVSLAGFDNLESAIQATLSLSSASSLSSAYSDESTAHGGGLLLSRERNGSQPYYPLSASDSLSPSGSASASFLGSPIPAYRLKTSTALKGAGPVLNALFDRLEDMLHQSYSVNLLVTASISYLLAAPVSWFKQFLLNPELPLSPNTRTLFACLTKVASEIRERAMSFEQFQERLASAKWHLAATSAPSGKTQPTATVLATPIVGASVAQTLGQSPKTPRVKKLASNAAMTLSELSEADQQQLQATALAFTCETLEARTFLLGVVVFEEFVKEISGYCQQYCLECIVDSRL